MKMKKEGWGLRVELVFILIFLICLVISTVLLSRVGLINKEDVDTSTSNYSALEGDLVEGAKKYIRENYDSDLLEEVTLVKYSTLKSGGYITNFKDGNGRECSGYVEVYKEEGSTLYYPYIKCLRYRTNNYDSSKDW